MSSSVRVEKVTLFILPCDSQGGTWVLSWQEVHFPRAISPAPLRFTVHVILTPASNPVIAAITPRFVCLFFVYAKSILYSPGYPYELDLP